MSGQVAGLHYVPQRRRLTGSAALASLRERPAADGPGEPLPWYKGGLGGTGQALPIPWDGGLSQTITGCGSPDCNGACGLEPASEPGGERDAGLTPRSRPRGGLTDGRSRICPQCSGPLGPGEMTCRTPGCRAPAGLAGLAMSGLEIH